MRIIWVRSGHPPIVTTIPHRLEHMQEIVGGIIEVVEPFDDDILLVCDENGRANGKPVNRVINDQIDICGDFFLCGQDSDSQLTDFPKEKIPEYLERFQ